MPLRHSLNRSEHRTITFLLLLVTLAACGGGSGDSPSATPVAGFDAALKSRISVSGVSAGGFMAVQSHVALADRIGGVGAVAAGPYHCAQGDVQTALSRCMTGEGLAVEPLVQFTKEAAAAGEIAPVAELESARVWVFHSPADSVVSPAAGRALADFYTAFVPGAQMTLVDDVETAHGWPTLDSGAACLEWGGDFINDCDYDTAGAILRHLHDDLAARAPQAKPENLVETDLSAYFGSGSDVAKSGYMYVPDACRSDARDCGLHIVFHGCVQGAEFIEDRFAAQSGFNEWAESNNLIVVYPQVEKSLFNPKGCWDWWGYTNGDYDLRSGKQVAGVAALIDAYASGTLSP
jgi:poly(3-hydroxybutyrate) depolymerase